MDRYYIEQEGKRLHIYKEHDMGVKWIGTFTDLPLCHWLVDRLNKTQGNYKVEPTGKEVSVIQK